MMPWLLFRILFSLAIVAAGQFWVQDSPKNGSTKNEPAKLEQVVIESFRTAHDGWSSDEVVLDETLNRAFIDACHERLPETSAAEFNWKLINLRKAGKLKIPVTKTKRVSVTDELHVAEIAARSMHDRHKISTDQIMTDPQYRTQFDQIARSIDATVDLYRVRKAAFQLRKTRRLRPELIARIADWGRLIQSFPAKQILEDPTLINEHPGIYIFRDQTGYLYIGQTDNLQERLKTHLDASHNLSLANYLGQTQLEGITIEVHSFDPDSRAKETRVRRAYESELIASRKPRFNIQP